MAQPTPDPARPARPARWHLRRWLAGDRAAPSLALAAVTVVLGVIYSGVFRGEPAGDDLTFHLAELRRLADCFRVGDFDLWNDSANAGFASAYYYQVVPLAVPAALAALTHTQVLPWFQLCIFLPLVLVPLAAYHGLRLMWATRWAAVCGGVAVAFTLSNSKWGHGADGTFLVGLYTQTWAFAAFPLAIGYAMRFLTCGERLGPAIAWGTFVGLCHPFAGIALGVAVVAGLGGEQARTVARRRWRPRASRAQDDAPDARGAPDAPNAPDAPDAPNAPNAPGAPRGALARWRVLAASLHLPAPCAEEPSPAPSGPGRALSRLMLLGAALILSSASSWLPVLVDYEGFGGFPHRVEGEDGPGFWVLLEWLTRGGILDARRLLVLTVSLPLVLLLARARHLRWLWSAALAYAFFLSIGPHLVTQDDLFPAVRFLGALQISLGLGIGAGLVAVGGWLHVALGRWVSPLAGRVTVAALGVVVLAALVGWGGWVQARRVYVAKDSRKTHRPELMAVIEALAKAPPGRKQALRGATSHWWNLLPYVYGERQALLQMGGGGLQASPSYDFLWTNRDPLRNAWLFDAPFVVLGLPEEPGDPTGEPYFRTRHYQVKKLPAPGLVSPVEVVGTLPAGRKPGHQAALAWLSTDLGQKNQHLAYAGSGGAGPAPQAKVLAVRRQRSPGDAPDLVAEVRVEQPSTLMFRESWHPRWTGLIDGQPAPVRRLTPSFAALDVPAGAHVIALRFDRPWWALAAWLLWPGCALLGALVSRRPSTSPANAP